MKKSSLLILFTVLLLIGIPCVGPAARAQQGVQIDATKKGEPISPYVYGQFIEHLGRCIYGGLWSEMLEDRKFYYPVTGEAPAWDLFTPGMRPFDGEGHPYELLVRSPWMIIGSKNAVSMVTEDSFVGDQTPRITAPGDGTRTGISQGRLGLEKDRNYVGRIVLAGDADAAPIEVSLVWGAGASDRQIIPITDLSRDFRSYPLKFRAEFTTDNGHLEIISKGSGSFLVGTASLMPADNILGWRKDTLARIRELDSPVYRWPGGNFVSGYDWKDGLGDPDRRPPRKNPAWKGIESNDVGIHEFMDFCRLVDTEPYIAVNTGLGDAAAASEEIEYVNGSADTPMGRLRARNGHPAPYGAKFWAIGNEMYGDWQLGHMPLEKYLEKHNQVVEAMRKVDSSFTPIGVGAAGDWSRRMLESCADHMDLISEHLYWQDQDDLQTHVNQVTAAIRRVAATHRKYRQELPSLANKNIRVALDEWNYWYGPNEYGELGVRYSLQDALGIAAGLHEMYRNSDIYYMANYAQTVNVIGAIKTTKTRAEMEPTGLVLALYRHHFGSIPVAVSGVPDGVDISAAWTSDGQALTVGIVNATGETQQFPIDVQGATPTGKGQRWVITGPDRYAGNRPGEPRGVDVSQLSLMDGVTPLVVPPLSVSVFRLEVR